MKITLDTEANAVYAYLTPKEERKALDRTKHESDIHLTDDGTVIIDKDGNGKILGIEFVPNSEIEIENITRRRIVVNSRDFQS